MVLAKGEKSPPSSLQDDAFMFFDSEFALVLLYFTS
jgi:hypothetical protein